MLVAAVAAGLLGAAVPAAAGTHVHVRGRVLDDAGRPVQGARVSFELHPNREVYDQRDCVVRPFEPKCRIHRSAGTTDANGRYRLPVRLSSFLASPRKHTLVVTDRAVPGALAPARTQLNVYFVRQDVDVPDLRVWRSRPTVDALGPLHRVLHVDPLSTAYGRLYSPGATAELLQGSDVVWSFPAVTEDRRVDARTVESGTTAIRATDRALVGALEVSYTSPAYAVTGGVRPLSRGAACLTYGRGDAPLALSGCRFTDGRLGARIDPAYQQARGKACDVKAHCDHPSWFVVDLGTAQPVGALAVPGCRAGAAEWSHDGTTYTQYPVHDLGDGLLLGPPLPVRRLRVDLAHCLFAATEVSLFAPV